MAQPHTASSSIIPTTVKVATILTRTGTTGMLSVATMVSLSPADILLLANVVVANVAVSMVSLLLANVVVAVSMVSLLLSDVVADMFGSNVAVEVVSLLLAGVVSILLVVVVCLLLD